MNKFGVAGLSALGLCATSMISMPAQAQDSASTMYANPLVFQPSFDFGISAAYYKADDIKVYGRDVKAPDGYDKFDADHITGKGFIGLNLNQWIGVEAQYIYLGRDKNDNYKIKGDGYTGALVLSLPIGDRFAVFAKGGEFWWDVDADGPYGIDISKNGHDPFYGAGVKFKLTKNFAIRAEYERVKIDKSDTIKTNIDLASAGIEFTF